MNIFFRKIHLYLALSAGLVIMITCFTGATLVFEKEMQMFIYPERYGVDKKENTVPLDSLVKALQHEVPAAKVSSVKIYADQERSVELTYTEEQSRKGIENQKSLTESKAIKKPKAGKGGSNQAFMNPHTGELISLYNYRNTFFYTMFSLHRWLLAGDIGKLIVGISTSIFLFILLTGIILWWPSTKKKLKQHLRVKTSGGWKRLNHDLHIVVGFYSSIFLFAIAFTGLAWSFQWFNDGIYWITGSENKRPEPPLSLYQKEGETISFDEVFNIAKNNVTNAAYYSIAAPKDSIGPYVINIMSLNPVHEKASDQYFVDQYSGAFLGTALYKDRNLGQRVRSTFYSIHTGSIGGIPGRIVAFFACLAGVGFPITGVILWINRLKKERKKKRKKEKHSANGVDSKVLVATLSE